MPTDEKRTRVDGKGLWRSWKRNFKTKLLALLDLIDNSLDAAIQGNSQGRRMSDSSSPFTGRVHVYPDVTHSGAEAKTTGLCIVNNSTKQIRPLEKVLEVYNSSKVDSGAGDIGENGVGLKQGCAALSDLSFVLVKNGSNSNIQLGIVAKSLQKEEGCYLPAFSFNDETGLREQMMALFGKPKHADVAKCVAKYGAASDHSEPNLTVGVDRLCAHFGQICNFYGNPYVFMLILDKVHHGRPKAQVQHNPDAEQKITVQRLIKELAKEIPQMYIHIPNEFDFIIGDQRMEFKYWPKRDRKSVV